MEGGNNKLGLNSLTLRTFPIVCIHMMRKVHKILRDEMPSTPS